jgi:hypothetical protein
MSDTTTNTTPPDPATGVNELLATIRDALAEDVGADVRSAGALACRVVLGMLDPPSRGSDTPSPSPASISSSVTSPLASLLSAIGRPPSTPPGPGSIPREQLLGLLAGALRSVLSQSEPMYRTAPTGLRPPDGAR